VLYNGDTVGRRLALDLFDNINNLGGIQ
jgi:hypothetical protein